MKAKKLLCFTLSLVLALAAIFPAYAADKCEHMVACTDQTKCVVCGATIKPGDVLYIDHNYLIISNKTEHGSKCSECGDVLFTLPHYTDCISDSKTTCSYCLADNVIIEKSNLKLHQGFDYTYEKDGVYYHAKNVCILCEKVISKEHIYKEKIEYEDGRTHKVICGTCNKTILSNFHSCPCTNTGECTVCKGKITDLENADIEHNFGEWVYVKTTTKTSAGLREHICADCGEKKSEILANITIKGNMEEVELNYGQVLHLEAEYEGGYPYWFVNDEQIKGDSFDYPASNGETQIFVSLYDKNGNIVSEEVGDGVVVTVNNNFWLRIVAFFKYTLFRMNNVVSFN